jgi:ACS family tartrate transporter-like MFS transporter
MSDAGLERQTMSTVSRRLLPFLLVLYVFCYLDRSNVSIAALQMNDELRFSSAVFGLGAGIFFFGYALFELPSNLVLARVGARLWIARIMVSWGILAAGMAFVKTPAEFYVVRFLLGVAEAGFFPGVMYYLADWFPRSYQGRAVARFTVGIPLAQALGGLAGAPLLGLGGIGGFSGWQWLFLAEGIPSILLGISVLGYLPDRPQQAAWLNPSQRAWLLARLEADRAKALFAGSAHRLRTLRDRYVWVLAIPYFAYFTVGFAYTAWAPQLIKALLGTQDSVTALVTGSIALISTAAYLIGGNRSDRANDRCAYAMGGLGLCILGCLGAASAPTPAWEFASLILIPLGGGIFMPSFWCLPRLRFDAESAAAPIAVISSIGSLGGFCGPTIVGYAKQMTGMDSVAFGVLALIGLTGFAVCWLLRQHVSFRRQPIETGAAVTHYN